MKALKVIIFILCASCALAADLNSLFPGINEMPGGRLHWMQSISKPASANGCTVYSATYAYFAEESKPLFDIPRKNIYSVNIRFHECPDLNTARSLYSKFSEVGEPRFKRLVSVGEKGTIYVQPNPKNPLMGDYYLTTIYRSIVMQVHSDDGFVMADMSDTMTKRLSRYLGLDESLQNGLTINISKDGYGSKSTFVSFAGDNISTVELNGIVYDQYNNRIPEAAVAIQETGDVTHTNGNGEFSFAISSGEDGETAQLFKAFDLAGSSTSGYFKVDIEYASQGKVGQDIWQLSIDPEGRVKGSSLNLGDGKVLNFTGDEDGGSMQIVRDCGSSLLGKCQQTFTGAKEADGMYKGTWTGTGGGGRWYLFPDSFVEEAVVLSLEEAGFNAVGSKISSAKPAGLNDTRALVYLVPQGQRHTDFRLAAARLILDVEPTIKSSAQRAIYLYAITQAQTLIAGASHTVPMDQRIQTEIDITDMYKNSQEASYDIGFAAEEAAGLEAELEMAVELLLATEAPKSATAGAVKATLTSLKGDDIMANVKAPRKDGGVDIAFELDIASYGTILKGIEIASLGKDKRSWNSFPSNVQPGIALLSGGTLLNEKDGSILYPLQKLDEKLVLHINKGSLKEADITGFLITLLIDNERVEREVVK